MIKAVLHTCLALWKHHVNLLLQSFRSVSSDLHSIISTDEDPSLIESSAIINLRGVSTKLNKYIVFTMQTYKKLIKAVLLSRLAMTQDSIRNTHTQMLWEKGFRGETLPVLVTKYGQNVIPKTHVTLH